MNIVPDKQSFIFISMIICLSITYCLIEKSGGTGVVLHWKAADQSLYCYEMYNFVLVMFTMHSLG